MASVGLSVAILNNQPGVENCDEKETEAEPPETHEGIGEESSGLRWERYPSDR